MGRSRSGTRRAVAAATVAALLVSVPATAEAEAQAAQAPRPPRGCTPGAPGLGDAYFPGYGNGGYDVRHYGLDLTYDPATDVLEGRASIDLRATQDLCSFNLDLVGLQVRHVEVAGRRATFTRDGQELVVTPRRPLREGQRARVTVDYDGVPVEFTLPGFGIPTGWMTTTDGVVVAGQPESATAWFPVNDHPLDKAAYTFVVTVPEGVEVVANGHLRSQRTRRGWTTWRWDAPEPMASYLATIDIGAWDVDRWRTGTGLPVYDAVDSAITGELRRQIDASLARQGEVLDVLSDAFGPYPFDTTGAIVDDHDEFLFALETQTRPVYSKFFWLDDDGNPVAADWVVVHELAHQWFGDDVALARWQDIWLNEGFASYAEWMWEEYDAGTPIDQLFQAVYDSFPAGDPFWSVVIGDPGVDQLFHDAVYVRGAMTLQALRRAVGDDAFWEIIRTWAARQGGGHGTTDAFIALAEEVSGRQLDALFDAWLFTPGRPALDPPGVVPSVPASESSAAAGSPAPAPVPADVAARAATWLADLERRLAHGPH